MPKTEATKAIEQAAPQILGALIAQGLTEARELERMDYGFGEAYVVERGMSVPGYDVEVRVHIQARPIRPT
jgi:hypothetical protein